VLWVSDRGKADASDWNAVLTLITDGYDVVSFDPRGLGETRMRYTAISVDDPAPAAQDFDRGYMNPLSGVLADYVYNSLLTGRPYMLQVIEDAEIAARFARVHLHATDMAITADGDAYTLAHDAAGVLRGLRLLPSASGRVLSWSALLMQQQETWPVQYVFPGGAYVR
jgi:hypothetical protein